MDICFDLPAGPRSPMMCMVCMALLTTWLFFTNSSVGSQLMIFNLEKLKSLKKKGTKWWFKGVKKSCLNPLKLDVVADPPTWCVVLGVFVADLPSSQPGLWGWIYLCLLIQQSTVQKEEQTWRKTLLFPTSCSVSKTDLCLTASRGKGHKPNKIHLCTDNFQMLTDWLNGWLFV